MVEQEVLECMNDIINTVVKKEETRIRKKKYYEKNREKLRKQQKDYRVNNNEKVKERDKKYYENNRDKKLEQKKKYYEKNRDKLLEHQIDYYQTENGFKSYKINKWKCNGVVCDNFDALYNHYTSTAYCDFCRVELSIDKKNTSTTKCLDHCHDTGLFRNILCLSCNIKRGQNNF